MALGFGFGLPHGTSFAGGNGAAAPGPSLNLDFTQGVLNNTAVTNNQITFSRTSNATLTGSNGLIQYAPHNLLTYSEQFDNAAWIKGNASISSNVIAAPDGTTTADKLTENSISTSHELQGKTTAVLPSVVSSGSIYAKAGERTNIIIRLMDDTTPANYVWANFNLSTGVVNGSGNIANGTGISASIVSVGNGWYRCIVSGTPNTSGTTTRLNIYLATGTGNTTTYLGDGTSGAYIWGAQLNVGSLQPYYPTTVKNLLGYTQEFDNAAWTKSNSTVTANATTAPDGSVTADKLVEASGSVTPYLAISPTVVAGTPYTMSVYAKAGQSSPKRYLTLLLPAANFGLNKRATFDLDAGTYVTTNSPDSASITSMGNGWYRCQVTAAATVAGAAGIQYRIASVSPDNLAAYTGDGTSGIYIWGAQLSDSASLDTYVYNPVAAPSAAAYYGPRFDYDPVTLQPKGLLIEEQRTNLLLNSDALATQNVTVSATAYTLSFYGTGTVTLSGTSTSGPLVGTGAYPNRVTLTFTPTAGTLTLTVTGSVRYAQLEAGAFATSYIPTTSAQATRAADVAVMQGANFSNWYNQSEGTFFAEAVSFGSSGTGRAIVGNQTNYYLYRHSAGSGAVYDGTNLLLNSALTAYPAFSKLAMAYTATTQAISVNGNSVTSGTSNGFVNSTQLTFGGPSGIASVLNGYLKRIAYYPRRLSNSELQGITA